MRSFAIYSGCALLVAALAIPLHSASAPVAAVVGVANAVDTVWYFTNRSHRDGDWTRQRGPLSYGVRTFDIAPARAEYSAEDEVRFRIAERGDEQLAHAHMMQALRHALSFSDDPLLLHVHGYATSMQEAAEEAAEMQQRGGFTGPVAIFAWTANDIGVTWPGAGKLFTNAYWQDAEAARSSAADLAIVLRDLVRELGADQVAVSAHSMGNQLLDAALRDSALSIALAATPLRAIAFVSPDLDHDYFVSDVGPRARSLGERVVLYGARDDFMLRMSAAVHDGRPRAGLFAAGAHWPAWLEVVDLTDGRTAPPRLGAWLDTNHALRRETSALVDLATIVMRNAPDACRNVLGSIQRDSSRYWYLTDVPPPMRVRC